jgi:hypothetical protein
LMPINKPPAETDELPTKQSPVTRINPGSEAIMAYATHTSPRKTTSQHQLTRFVLQVHWLLARC